MDEHEWADLYLKLNLSYPGQALPPEKAAEYFEELEPYPARRVERAIRRCRRERSFLPTIAELIDAMLANARDQATEPSPYRAIEARDPNSPGVPPPDDYKAARERFLAASRVPEPPNGRPRAKQLAELEAEMRKEAEAS